MTRHGEYKMPGGKLVVADLAIRDARLAEVAVSGDFFLDPDNALTSIDTALTGQPASADETALAATVRDALPAGTTLYGVSPEAIAVAVRRAIDNGEPR